MFLSSVDVHFELFSLLFRCIIKCTYSCDNSHFLFERCHSCEHTKLKTLYRILKFLLCRSITFLLIQKVLHSLQEFFNDLLSSDSQLLVFWCFYSFSVFSFSWFLVSWLVELLCVIFLILQFTLSGTVEYLLVLSNYFFFPCALMYGLTPLLPNSLVVRNCFSF